MHVDGCLVRDKCICALGRCRDDAAIRAPAGSSGWSEVQLLTSILTELKRRDEAFAVTLLAIMCGFTWKRCNTEPRCAWALAMVISVILTTLMWVLVVLTAKRDEANGAHQKYYNFGVS